MICSVEDCDGAAYSRGLCERHYRQVLRHGQVRAPRVSTCSVEACDRRVDARGLCHGHYLRWLRHGDAREDAPLSRTLHVSCSVEGCTKPHQAQGLCRAHYQRLRASGSPRPGEPLRAVAGGGFVHHGYRFVPVAPEERWWVDGQTSAAEHRLVMARFLGRPLTPDESVHHRNGDRLDNRLANLELWSRYQPAGQRVADKLDWALEVVALYAPHLLREQEGPDIDDVGAVSS